nr:MAG TPA: hypothetical protein [Caudoviricetes sp.]
MIWKRYRPNILSYSSNMLYFSLISFVLVLFTLQIFLSLRFFLF